MYSDSAACIQLCRYRISKPPSSFKKQNSLLFSPPPKGIHSFTDGKQSCKVATLFQKIFGEIPMNAENSMRERIDKMFRNDRLFAYVMLIGAWLAVWFVVDQVAALGPPGNFMGLVYVSALALCVFNTASIIAMVKHYEHAKEHIYRQDIEHLDAIAVSNK